MFNPLNMLEEMPATYASWSNPVTHTLPFSGGEPRNLVGVKAPNCGSNVPISTVGHGC